MIRGSDRRDWKQSQPIGTLDTTASGGPAVDAIILSGAGEDTVTDT
jgi:hypothetical protein